MTSPSIAGAGAFSPVRQRRQHRKGTAIEQAHGDADITNTSKRSRNWRCRAVRPRQRCSPCAISPMMRYYWSAKGHVSGIETLISRTGYTGEDGFELLLRRRWPGTLAR